MVLILTSEGGTGYLVAKGLEKLGISVMSCGSRTEFGDIRQYDAVFFTGEAAASSAEFAELAKTVCAECAAEEIPVIFDPTLGEVAPENYALINRLASLCDIFVPSDEDAKALCGLNNPEEIAERYLDAGTKKVVVTLDKNGAYFKSAKESGSAPTFRADKVVDTTGAGSAFAAGLISGIIEDIPLAEAVVRANACGSISIQKEGEYFPDMSELREYMLSHRFVVDGCKEY